MSEAAQSSNYATATNQSIKVFQGHTEQVSSLVYSRDGRQALSGSYDHTVILWDVENGQLAQHFQGHTNWIRSVALSPDAQLAVSGSMDSTMRLWECKSGKEIYSFTTENNTTFQAVDFTADGQYLLSGGEDGAVRLWSIRERKEVRCLGEHMTGVICAKLSPDGRRAAAAIGKSILLWEVAKESAVIRLDNHRSRIKDFSFAADARTIISAAENVVYLWDVETGTELKQLAGYNRWIHGVAISPDGRYAYASYDSWVDKKIQLILRRWSIDDSKEALDTNYQGHSMSGNVIAFSSDGQHFLTGSADASIRLWHIPE
ncbi:MAG: WD40 repeat domain-containing protein [Acidobacteriota bacterium]